MNTRDFTLDLIVLPLLVVIHCVVVFAALCLYIYGMDYVFYAPTQAQELPRTIAELLGFGMPLALAVAAAWLSWRFIIKKIARTEVARTSAAILMFGFAVAIPVIMFPVDLVIGCMVTSEKVGKPICL